jgi:hypothetical protein
MKLGKPRSWCLTAAAVLGLCAAGGCQTYFPETGQTLPTPRYLDHLPQYFPPSPVYPLPRELSNLEQASVAPPQAGPRANAPAP